MSKRSQARPPAFYLAKLLDTLLGCPLLLERGGYSRDKVIEQQGMKPTVLGDPECLDSHVLDDVLVHDTTQHVPRESFSVACHIVDSVHQFRRLFPRLPHAIHIAA